MTLSYLEGTAVGAMYDKRNERTSYPSLLQNRSMHLSVRDMFDIGFAPSPFKQKLCSSALRKYGASPPPPLPPRASRLRYPHPPRQT